MSQDTFDQYEPPGSQKYQDDEELPDSDYKEIFVEPRLHAFLWNVVQEKIDQSSLTASRLQSVLPATESGILQALKLYGSGAPSVETVTSPSSQDSMIFDDPLIEVAETDDEDVEAEKYDQFDEYGEDEDDEDEFDTIDEAREYAVRLSWEIFEEVLDEVIKEKSGASGMLDVSNEVREQMCMDLVFPDVWEEMGA